MKQYHKLRDWTGWWCCLLPAAASAACVRACWHVCAGFCVARASCAIGAEKIKSCTRHANRQTHVHDVCVRVFGKRRKDIGTQQNNSIVEYMYICTRVLEVML